MGGRRGWAWVLLLAGATPGCRSEPAPPPGTGAKEVVQGYYEALIRQDWAAAYAALDPRTRSRYGPELFTRRAQYYRHGLGFEPHAVHVRSCEEHGAEAIARVALTGRGAARHRRYQDGTLLRRGTGGWGIVLSDHFGRTSPP
jgi:hypothetical protein